MNSDGDRQISRGLNDRPENPASRERGLVRASHAELGDAVHGPEDVRPPRAGADHHAEIPSELGSSASRPSTRVP